MSDQWRPSPQPTQPPEASSSTTGYVVLGGVLVVVMGLLAVVTGVIGFGDSTSGSDTLETVEAPIPAPVFEPAFVEGDDPFFPLELQLAGFEEESGRAPTDQEIASGLYGGSAQNTCDPQRLITFLMENPAKGHAWAHVQGIEFDEIPDYINSLMVRVLAAPSVVLNHGFDADTGAPYEIETTLDAGTAVLVDANGDIRTRCYCGNPTKPKPVGHQPPRCLTMPALLFTTPGGDERRSAAPAEVRLTGMVSTDDAWTEVSWGSTESERGWTPTSNIGRGLCITAPPPVPTPPPAATPPPATTAPPTAPTPTPTPTASPTATPTPTSTPQPAPTATATPVPPAPGITPTPTPTPTPAATATPTPTVQPLVIRCFLSDTQLRTGDVAELSAFHVGSDAQVEYAFDHGDGTIDSRNPSFASYNSPGSYEVYVIATVDGTEQRQFCGTINVVGETTPVGCNTQGYIGLTEAEAGLAAEGRGCAWRVVRRAGVDLIVTADFDPNRVNFVVGNDGRVTGASMG